MRKYRDKVRLAVDGTLYHFHYSVVHYRRDRNVPSIALGHISGHITSTDRRDIPVPSVTIL